MISRWGPQTLAIVHLVTLGFLMMVMVGAVYQVMPVLTGIPLPGTIRLAPWVHAALLSGALLVPAGLVGAPWAASIGIIVLGAALTLFLLQAMAASLRVGWGHQSGRSITLALLALLATTWLGLTLLAGHAGWQTLPHGLTDLHWVWAVGGWMGLLVMGVGFQVVPMFQVTPTYPRLVRCCLPAALWFSLALWSAARWNRSDAEPILAAAVSLSTATFAFVTLRLQRQRRRKISDVTVRFWQFGLLSLLAALALLPMARADGGNRLTLLVGISLLAGWGVSIISGMLYKIVPFLAWLSLQNALVARSLLGRHRIPNMKQFIGNSRQEWQFRAHLVAVMTLAAAPWGGDLLVRVAGLLLALSFGLLGSNLVAVYLRYRRELARLPAA